MHTALYRAYRPETFDEILGQQHIVRILMNQLATDTVSHAYLFCGTRGTGKTTTARILAKGVNCTADGERPCGGCDSCLSIKDGTFIDVIEIDAASNNGVENIRELRESVKYPPAAGKKKVYIIDEVHMLSTGAFNALLKTLEEPPESVIFILATTEPQKLPATILSRCMRLDFKRVAEKTMVEAMTKICEEKSIAVSENALRLIAVNADGSVRDGLSILEQCISIGKEEISREDVLEFLGAAGEEVFIELTDMVLTHETSEAIMLLDRVLADGKDVKQFLRGWLEHYRNLLMTKFIKNPADMLNMSGENTQRVSEQSERVSPAEINRAIIEISKTMSEAKWSTKPRILLELCIVKLSAGISDTQASPVAVKAPAKEPIRQRQAEDAGKTVKNTATADTGKASGKKATGEKISPQELDKLWHAIFEDGEMQKGSFNIIRAGTRLTEMTDSEFIVEVSGTLTESYVEKNRETLEDLMEKHTGKRRMISCFSEGEQQTIDPGNDIEKLAEEASSKLGIDIEIE